MQDRQRVPEATQSIHGRVYQNETGTSSHPSIHQILAEEVPCLLALYMSLHTLWRRVETPTHSLAPRICHTTPLRLHSSARCRPDRHHLPSGMRGMSRRCFRLQSPVLVLSYQRRPTNHSQPSIIRSRDISSILPATVQRRCLATIFFPFNGSRTVERVRLMVSSSRAILYCQLGMGRLTCTISQSARIGPAMPRHRWSPGRLAV